MPTAQDISARIALATQHVEEGRALVARVRKLITEIESKGGDASVEKRLLRRLEKNVEVFLKDRDTLINKYQWSPAPDDEGK
jgi:hypothetical protein